MSASPPPSLRASAAVALLALPSPSPAPCGRRHAFPPPPRLPASATPRHGDLKKLLLQCIDGMTADVDIVQRRVLAEILARNAEAEYLASCGISSASSGGTTAFRANVPMATYEDILTVTAGDRSAVLTTSENPVSEFLLSSGTSGGGRTQAHPRRQGRQVQAAGLTSLLKSDCFKNRRHDPYHEHTSPAVAVLCDDATQSMYAQLACGLRHRRAVAHVGAAFGFSQLLTVVIAL